MGLLSLQPLYGAWKLSDRNAIKKALTSNDANTIQAAIQKGEDLVPANAADQATLQQLKDKLASMQASGGAQPAPQPTPQPTSQPAAQPAPPTETVDSIKLKPQFKNAVDALKQVKQAANTIGVNANDLVSELVAEAAK